MIESVPNVVIKGRPMERNCADPATILCSNNNKRYDVMLLCYAILYELVTKERFYNAKR